MPIEGKRYIVDWISTMDRLTGGVIDQTVQRAPLRVRTCGGIGNASPVAHARAKPIEYLSSSMTCCEIRHSIMAALSGYVTIFGKRWRGKAEERAAKLA